MVNKIVYFLKKHWIFLSFLTYSGVCWSWILGIDLAKLASTNSAGVFLQFFVIVTITLLSAAIYTKSFRYLFASIRGKTSWLVPIKLVLWWAITELFVSWAVSIIWYGDGARIDNVLPFTSLGNLAIWTPLGFLSRFVGFHGLSGVVFMLLAITIKPTLRRYFVLATLAVTSLTILAWWAYRVPSGPIVNAVVVTEQSSEDRMGHTLAPKDGSLVVFPEYSFNGLESENVNTKVEPRSRDEVVYFVSSRFVYEKDKIKNQLVAGDTISGYDYKIDKSRLIPGGEYLAYVGVGLLKLIGANEVLDNFRVTRQISRGDGSQGQMLLNFGDLKVGAGICSNIIAPEDYRKLAKNGANVFTNSAYLGIFKSSRLYGWHQESMARFMATANARVFLQSASNGPSLGIDSNGRRIFYQEETGVKELSVSLNNKRTLYSFLGEYIAGFGLVWVLVDFVKSRKRKV